MPYHNMALISSLLSKVRLPTLCSLYLTPQLFERALVSRAGVAKDILSLQGRSVGVGVRYCCCHWLVTTS